MDDELRKYLDGMMAQINGQFERVLNRLTAVERDFQNTKNFLVGDALVSGGRWLDLEARVAKPENDKPYRPYHALSPPAPGSRAGGAPWLTPT